MAGSAARRRRRYSASKGKSSTNRLHTNKLLITPDFGSVIMEWAADRIPHPRISVTAPVMAPLVGVVQERRETFLGRETWSARPDSYRRPTALMDVDLSY